MKKTKQKILDTSLVLFNSSGLATITLRTIANELGISQGNLNYHFKRRDDIIETLYYQLVAEINESMMKILMLNSDLKSLKLVAVSIMKSFYKYRFFMLDFSHIMKQNEKVRAHYAVLSSEREDQIQAIFFQLVEQGVLRPEKLNREYHYLYKRTQILMDFWMSSVQIEKKEISDDTIETYLEILIQSIYPYLTPKGVEMYHQLNSTN